MEEISPELALVDPELAAKARGSLPSPTPALPVERAAKRPRRRLRRVRRATAVAGLLAVLGLAGAGAVEDEGSAPRSSSGVLGARKVKRAPPRTLPASGQPSRVFTWNETDDAAYYYVVFVRNGKTFYTAKTTDAWLRLPEKLKLRPGSYRWSVQPAVAGDSGIVVEDAILVHTFRIGRG